MLVVGASDRALTPANSVFIVTIRRGELSEPESFHIPAPSPEVAERRVRSIAKAPRAAVLAIQPDTSQTQN